MYYINEHEEEVLLNELLHDDSTSCSSLATTVSVTDDIDELYLGAEGRLLFKEVDFYKSILIFK